MCMREKGEKKGQEEERKRERERWGGRERENRKVTPTNEGERRRNWKKTTDQ